MDRKAKVLAVANRKGGVGKTTTAVSLGYGLAKKLQEDGGGNVLIVDLDAQGNAAPCLNVKVNGHPTLAEVLVGEVSVQDAVLPAGDTRPGLFLLPATDTLAKAKVKLLNQAAVSVLTNMATGGEEEEIDMGKILSARMALAAAVFDYIILDCPPSIDVLTNAIYEFADSAIIPVRPDFLGGTGTARHTRNIVEAQARGIDIEIGWIVPTFFRSREILANEVLDGLKSMFPGKVAPPIPQNVALEQAPASGGLTIFEYEPDSAGAKAYQKLVELVYNDV